jgi:response regulator RpfG family c-di-GMP phosphodiesterase
MEASRPYPWPPGNMASILNTNGSVDPQGASIVVYSADRDLCESLQMLLQDSYRVITVRDDCKLATVVGVGGDQILVADIEPSQQVTKMFQALKEVNSCLRIIFFYSPRFHDQPLGLDFRQTVDAVMFKPIDLDSFTERVSELAVHH